MNVDNYVITRGESGKLIALNMDKIQAFWQEDGEDDVVTVQLSGQRVYLKGTFVDAVNAVRMQAGVEPVTIEQIKAALSGGAE